MDVRFEYWEMENSAIYIILDSLEGYLKDKDERAAFQPLDEDKATEKEKVFYQEIYVPYWSEKRDHMDYHLDGAVTDTWRGEQACLSAIHCLNQKAWWLLYYYAVSEAVSRSEKGIEEKLGSERLKNFAKNVTSLIIDDNMTIQKAVTRCNNGWIYLSDYAVEKIVDDVSKKAEEYKKRQSVNYKYR